MSVAVSHNARFDMDALIIGRPKRHEVARAIETIVELTGWPHWKAKNIVLWRAEQWKLGNRLALSPTHVVEP
jgi:hypothetical protein